MSFEDMWLTLSHQDVTKQVTNTFFPISNVLKYNLMAPNESTIF